jgi:signal transduction histidine kinase
MTSRLSGLHLQFLGLILLPFSLMLIAVAVIAVGVHEDAMRRLVSERDERSARAAAAALSQNLQHLSSAAQSLAQRVGNGGDPMEIVLTSERFLRDFDLGFAILDGRGELLAASTPDPDWLAGVDPHLLTSDSPGFSESSLDTGLSMLFATAPGDDVVVIGASTLQNLGTAAMLTTMARSEGSAVFLVDRSGSLLYYVGEQPPEPDLVGHPGVSEGLRGETGSTFRQANGIERVVAFAPVAPTNWALIFEEPWRAVASPVLNLSLLAPLALIPALLITLVGLWFGASRVIRPLRELQAQAEEMAIAEATFEASGGGGIAEIQNLQHSLNRMTRRISTAQKTLQRYVGAVTEAQEEERNRLARELHDETIQGLIAIDHQIQMLSMEFGEADLEIRRALRQLHEQVNRAIHELRRMTKALRPIYLEDLGLVPAIQMLADEVSRESGVTVTVDLTGDPRRLRRETELAVYRIVQEALNNVSRHSKASAASLAIKFAEDRFEASVQDDGRGFEVPESEDGPISGGHFGLMGMIERAELVGAELDIHSEQDKGTLVRVIVHPEPQSIGA